MNTKKATKRALLTSVMALVMCVVMLVGTTFAWFTDTASTGVNKIQAGTLKVDIVKADGETSIRNESMSFVNKGGSADILWEPGATFMTPAFKIKSTGSLALKYKLTLNGITGDNMLLKVIKFSVVKADGTEVDLDTFEGHLTPDAALSEALYIKGHMDETANNDYQGKTLEGLGITVVATQDTVEYDSKDNLYDKDAKYDLDVWTGELKEPEDADADGVYHITSAAELVYVMQNSTPGSAYYNKPLALDTNIDLNGRSVKGFNNFDLFCNSFDGQGHTISNFTMENTTENYTGLFGYVGYGGSVKNLTVKNATIVGQKMVGVIAGAVEEDCSVTNCHVEDCTVVANVKKAGAVVGYTSKATVTGCSAKNVTVCCAHPTEAGEIVGYINNGSTVENNSFDHVNVICNVAMIIRNASDMVDFAKEVNENHKPFTGKNVVLVNDIDLKNMAWAPVGQTGETQFVGTFDGQGHTIKNLNVVSANNNRYYAYGLFGWLNGTVKNLTVDGASVTASHYAGVIAGYNELGYIENCTVKHATVTGKHVDNGDYCGDKIGGIVGFLNAHSVKNCKVENTTITAGRDAGQVIGCAASGATVENCTASDVTVTYSGDCTGENIKNDIVGRDLRS